MNLFYQSLATAFANKDKGFGVPAWISGDRMILSKKSPLSGKIASMELPVTMSQWLTWCSPDRPLVHECFPGLSATQREFLLTGYTDEDWNAMFPDEEDVS